MNTHLILSVLLFLYPLSTHADTNAEMDVAEHDKEYNNRNQNAYQKGLPQVYSCGDSISVGYAPWLKASVKGRLSVVHRNDLSTLFPGKLSEKGYTGLSFSLIELTTKVLESDAYQPKYLLLNSGLHDVFRGGANLKKYEKDLNTIINLTKKHGTQLIWLTTTPKAAGVPGNKKVIQFNDKAKEMMARHRIPVIDLHSTVLDLSKKHGEAKIISQDKVHFTTFAYKELAKYIDSQLTPLIKKN